MAAEDFFNRWRRRGKAEDDKQMPAGASLVQQEQALPIKADPAPPSPPTQADLEKLRPDADFSAFMASDVDETVRRSAMKKLFSDPHFNVMDGLDIYIDDYNKFEPIPAAMLASLSHAKGLLDPLSQLEKPVMPPLPLVQEAPSARQSAPADDEKEAAAQIDSSGAQPSQPSQQSQEKERMPESVPASISASSIEAESLAFSRQAVPSAGEPATHLPAGTGPDDSILPRQ